MKFENINTTLLILAAAGVVGAVYLSRKTVETVKDVGHAINDVGHAINPVNPNNAIYGAANAVGGALTNDSNFSLGSWIYDQFHPAETETVLQQGKSLGTTGAKNNG